MQWTDSLEIAIQLDEAYPDVDPQYLRFTDLHNWVCTLQEFEDDPARSSEKTLESIQMAWIEERS